MDKKGQELSTNTIILIILGLVVMALLIFGFIIGWDKVLPFIQTNNVKSIVSACQAACATQSQYDFCTVKRELKAETVIKEVTCNELATNPTYTVYGVNKCPSLCPQPEAGTSAEPDA
ncbi:MAG: hypothetical protein AABX28_01615 [Nanoarchaeota archaeon]